ncbi:MAG: choice-of-anchor L domain-containing protein, partial [Verrucomicrobia bacterium]|nr:choice-of-anchor L domain-containing protein [Verrucomicrobiota bacterium]
MKKPPNHLTTMKQLKTATDIVSLCVMGLLTGQASALSLTLIDGSVSAPVAGNTLTAAVLAPASGINVVAGSIGYQGTTNANLTQAATYTGFSLAPSSGSTPTLNLGDGIFLTSGSSNIPFSNTANNFSNSLPQPASGSNSLLTTLSGQNTYDANALSFQFTVDPGVT